MICWMAISSSCEIGRQPSYIFECDNGEGETAGADIIGNVFSEELCQYLHRACFCILKVK
jgi:hypothetical protein